MTDSCKYLDTHRSRCSALDQTRVRDRDHVVGIPVDCEHRTFDAGNRRRDVQRFNVIKERSLHKSVAPPAVALLTPGLTRGLRERRGEESSVGNSRNRRDRRDLRGAISGAEQRHRTAEARTDEDERRRGQFVRKIERTVQVVNLAANRQIFEIAFGVTDIGEIEA